MDEDEDDDDDDDDDDDEDGSSIQTRLTRTLVKLWDVENGTPKSSTLFKVTDVDAGVTLFSPDGQFLAIERWLEGVIELWNVEEYSTIPASSRLSLFTALFADQ